MSDKYVQEKSLLEIWSKSLPKIPKNRFNCWASVSGLLLGVFPFAVGPINNYIDRFQTYTDLLSTVYAGLLGFILAGYAIFTTAGNPKFLLAVWKHKDTKSGVPLLKLHLFVFVRLFIVVFISMLVVIGQSLAFRLWPTLEIQVQLSNKLRIVGQGISCATIGWTITATSIQLKTLIYNLYNLTLTQVQFLEIDAESEK